MGRAAPQRLGELMGGPVAERADVTDKIGPKLVKYDRWGHDVSEVIIPESAQATKRDLIERGFSGPTFRDAAEAAGVPPMPLTIASGYLLNQAEIGMSCAMGADAGMVESQVAQFAPPDIRQLVLSQLESGEWIGRTGQFFTERTGGSDLGAPRDDRHAGRRRLACSTASSGSPRTSTARPSSSSRSRSARRTASTASRRSSCCASGATAAATASTSASSRRSSARTPSPRAKLSSPTPKRSCSPATPKAWSGDGGGPSDGRSVSRLMAMTNVARLGVALMGLGCARRALVESLCYANGPPLLEDDRSIDHPLMKRKLAEMIVDVEAVQAILFDGYGYPNHQRQEGAPQRLRMVPALVKLKAARLGITMASDAIEIHGGNGYVETWPVARILRDAQINTLWEGPDNILCLDVRRAIERERRGRAVPRANARGRRQRRRSDPRCPRRRPEHRRPPDRDHGLEGSSTATSPRRASSRSRSSWPRSTPPPSSASRPSGSSANSATTARRSSPRSTPSAT